MIKNLLTAFFAFTLLAAPAMAQGSKTKAFKGNYDGASQLQNPIGDSIFYTPIKLKVDKKGNVSGTAAKDIIGDEDALGNDIPTVLLTVTGKIKKVKTSNGGTQGKASGTFSDGTKWTGTFMAFKGVSAKTFSANGTNGSFSGIVVATKL